MAVERSAALWVRHVLSAWIDDPDQLVVTMDSFFGDSVVTLGRIASHAGLPAPGPAVIEAATDHLDPSLLHHGATGSHTGEPSGAVSPTGVSRAAGAPESVGGDATSPTPMLALAAQVHGALIEEAASPSEVLGPVASVIAEGWLRPAADSAAFAEARAEVVDLTERLRRHRRTMREMAAKGKKLRAQLADLKAAGRADQADAGDVE